MTINVAYIPPFSYPQDSSSALRVSGMAHALVLGGLSVTVASTPIADGSPIPHRPTSGVSTVDRQVSTPRGTLRRVFSSGSDITAWLDQLAPAPDLVLLYGTDYRYVFRTARWASRRGIPLAFDIVEWYDSTHLPLGRFGPYAILNGWAMRRSTLRAAACVTISSYLARHYGQHDVPTVTVPPVFDATSEMSRDDRFSLTDRAFHIGYVGVPGKKDAATLENLLTLVHERPESAPPIHVHLAGPDPLVLGPRLTSALARSRVTLHGRLDRSAALALVSRCDATALQRPGKRYAQAGFPSKVVESLMCGTPVLANLTSDLDRYLTNEVNSVILEDETFGSLCDGVDRAIRLGHSLDHDSIRTQAQAVFSPSTFAAPLATLLVDAVRRHAR